MDHKSSFFKKADILLAAALLLLGFGSLLLLQRGQTDGAYVRVTVDGKLYASYALSGEQIVRIATPYGENLLRIDGDGARMIDADCHGKDCVESGAIAKQGQMILCLPHRLCVTITGEEGGAPDAVSY